MRVRIAVEVEVELDGETLEEAREQDVTSNDITPKSLARIVGGTLVDSLRNAGVDFVWEQNIGYQLVEDNENVRDFGG